MALHSGYKPDEHPNSTQLKHHSHLEFPDSPVIDQYKCNKAGREFAQWICRILTILKALNPTTTHSFMAALHISMSLLIPSGLNSHVDIQISIELKQQNR